MNVSPRISGVAGVEGPAGNDAGELTPAQIARLREMGREVVRETGVPVRDGWIRETAGRAMNGSCDGPLPAPSAASPTVTGVPVDRFEQGIPVHGPYRVAPTTAGFIMILAGFVVMRYRRTLGRFENHRRLRTVGGVFSIAGLSSGISKVRLSGVPYLHHTRSILGAVTIVPIAAPLAPGRVIPGGHDVSRSFRRMHRYVGGIPIALGAVDIALGLSVLPPIVALQPCVTEDECCT